MTVLPLTPDLIRVWAENVGDNVAGRRQARAGCIIANAARDLLGVEVLVDYQAAVGVAYVEDVSTGERQALPDWCYGLVRWLDTGRRRQVTGNQVAAQLARLAS